MSRSLQAKNGNDHQQKYSLHSFSLYTHYRDFKPAGPAIYLEKKPGEEKHRTAGAATPENVPAAEKKK